MHYSLHPRYGDTRRLITICGVPGVDPHLLLQLLLSSGHARCWLGVVLEPHSVFRSWTIFDRIVDDDWFSVVLRFFSSVVWLPFLPPQLFFIHWMNLMVEMARRIIPKPFMM